MLIEILSGRKRVFPDVDAGHEVDGVAELGKGHVKLVHGGQVFAGFPVTLDSRSFLRINEFPLFALFLVHHLKKKKIKMKICFV
jgi:hypothetical protein